MDDYEKWQQELRAKSADELETLVHGYGDAISQLITKKYAIEKQLDMLRDQSSTVRRMYVLKVREENAKQWEKALFSFEQIPILVVW